MRIVLIRHGATKGNLERRYIGRTDEGLCPSGRESLDARRWPDTDFIAVSPMRRCIETVQRIYPGRAYTVIDDFKECDFGAFEGKNAQELSGNPEYQAWIDSFGERPFPHGERPSNFRQRTVRAFETLVKQSTPSLAIVAHGGTIMAILDRYGAPEKKYFDWHLPNAGMYECRWNGEKLCVLRRLP